MVGTSVLNFKEKVRLWKAPERIVQAQQIKTTISLSPSIAQLIQGCVQIPLWHRRKKQATPSFQLDHCCCVFGGATQRTPTKNRLCCITFVGVLYIIWQHTVLDKYVLLQAHARKLSTSSSSTFSPRKHAVSNKWKLSRQNIKIYPK